MLSPRSLCFSNERQKKSRSGEEEKWGELRGVERKETIITIKKRNVIFQIFMSCFCIHIFVSVCRGIGVCVDVCIGVGVGVCRCMLVWYLWRPAEGFRFHGDGVKEGEPPDVSIVI